jgi:hypothetical protein
MMAVDDQSVPQVENITKNNISFNTFSTHSIYILLALKPNGPNTIWTSSAYYVSHSPISYDQDNPLII